MLISRDELSFDFGAARFDLNREADRRTLGWIFNQFLYGEVTGIQCGYWLYRAPHLNAASFLARQALEELSHVKRVVRILNLIGEKPAEAHPAIRFLSTGMMGGSWGEHVTIEMALGEGLVLTVFYALADTIDDPEIKKIIESAIVDEVKHVEFGEREASRWLSENPGDRRHLLGQAMVQLMVLRKLKRFVIKRLQQGENADHPVLARFPDFYDHVCAKFEKRVELLGISKGSISQMSLIQRWGLLASVPLHFLRSKFRRKRPLLTSTYLSDPAVLRDTEAST